MHSEFSSIARARAGSDYTEMGGKKRDMEKLRNGALKAVCVSALVAVTVMQSSCTALVEKIDTGAGRELTIGPPRETEVPSWEVSISKAKTHPEVLKAKVLETEQEEPDKKDGGIGPVTELLTDVAGEDAEADMDMGSACVDTASTGTPEIDSRAEEVSAEVVDYAASDEIHVIEGAIVTAYCSCETCCGYWATIRPTDEYGNQIVYTSTGVVATQGETVAVNPGTIPHWSYVYVRNAATGEWHEFRATDTSPTANHVDVYFSNHIDALYSGYGGRGTVYWSSKPVDITAVCQ